MNYPLISEYVEAIKAAEDNFDQLKHLRPVLDDDGMPVMSGGNFAVVFKMKDEQTGKLHAVKCFLKEQEGRAEAYRQIAEELEYVSSTFLTPIKYLDKELFVDSANSEDSEFPVLLMDWVEGQTLDKYIREHIDDQYELSLLAYQFSRLAMWLMPQPFAHGDLKPDNILVKEDGTLVLVDYDGMYVPAMKGQKARELGSPDFRHPGRTENDFDEHIDDFSLASILLSLKATSLKPSLLEEYGAQDRLLFSEKDYRNLSESEALNALRPLMQDAELASLYSLFILALSQKNLSGVSFRLFNLKRPSVSSIMPINMKDDNQSNKKIIKKELLSFFQGKKNVTHIVVSNGTSSYLTKERSFSDEAYLKGACKLNTVENEKKHVLFFFNDRDVEVGRYYIGNKLQGLTPTQLTEIKHELCFFESWNPETKKWVPCVGKTQIDNKEENLSTEEKEEEYDNHYIDEYGVWYSVDGSRLITAPDDLEEYNIRQGTKIICDRAFELSEKISSINIPHSVLRIGKNAFAGCMSLSQIYIPGSVLGIGDSAFSGSGLKKITIPDSIDKIDDYVFSVCEKLQSVILPNSIKIIGNHSFSECTKLKTIKIPDNVSKIDDFAFLNCHELESVIMPQGIDTIGEDIFYGCNSLNCICVPKDCMSKYEKLLPGYEDKLVEYDGDGNLTADVTNEDLERAWTDENGVKYSHDKKRILRAPKEIRDYSIIEGTMVICNNVFTNLFDRLNYFVKGLKKSDKGIVSITVPNSVILIGKNAFSYCPYLTSIYIPIGTKQKFEKLLPEYKDKLVEKSNIVSITFDNSSTSKVDRCRVFKKDNDWKLEIVYKNGMKVDYPHSLLQGNQSIEFDKQTIEKIQLYVGYCEGFYINPKAVEVDFEYSSKFSAKILFDSDFIEISGITWGLYNNINDWKVKGVRSFNLEERLAVNRAEVVASDYGASVCFFMNAGGQTYIPLDENSELTIGEELNINTAKLITLSQNGKKDVVRVME